MFAQCHMAAPRPRQNSDLPLCGQQISPTKPLQCLPTWRQTTSMSFSILGSYAVKAPSGHFHWIRHMCGALGETMQIITELTHICPLDSATLSDVTAHVDNCNIFKAQSGKLECLWSKRPGESWAPPAGPSVEGSSYFGICVSQSNISGTLVGKFCSKALSSGNWDKFTNNYKHKESNWDHHCLLSPNINE